jgi:hypothetical protein
MWSALQPDVSNFALAVYEQLEAYKRGEEPDYPLLLFVAAISTIFDEADQYARAGPNGEDPWSILLDINRMPDNILPWFGQLVGVEVDTSLPPDRQRQQIRTRQGWLRGSVAGIVAAVQNVLFATKTVEIVERDTSAWHFTIATYGGETPPDLTYQDLYDDYASYAAFYAAFATYEAYWETMGSTQVINAILSQKPAGDMFSYSILTGWPTATVWNYELVFIRKPSYTYIWNTEETYGDLYVG